MHHFLEDSAAGSATSPSDANAAAEIAQTALAAPAFSRRTLFGLTAIVGALHFIGSAAGGRVMAYADEVTGDVHFSIVVLARDEISVMAVDAANNAAALPDVAVTITSAFNDKVVTGKTGADGICVLNVRALSVQGDDDKSDEYSFYAAAELKKPGYREFAFTNSFVQAGAKKDGTAHIMLYSQPFDAARDGAYIRMGCFDGNDMLHSVADMPKFPKNTINHNVTFQIVCTPGKTVNVAFLGNDKVIGQPGSAVANSDGIAQVTITAPVVATQEVGTSFSCTFQVENGSATVTRKAPLRLSIDKPDIETNGFYYSEDWMASIGSGAGLKAGAPKEEGTKGFALGDYRARYATFPPFSWGGAADLSLDFPWLPINFIVDQRGGIALSFRTDSFTIFSKNRESKKALPNATKWYESMKHPISSWFESFCDKLEYRAGVFNKAKQMANAHHGFGAAFFYDVSVSASVEGGLYAFFMDPGGKSIKTWEGAAFFNLCFLFTLGIGFQVYLLHLPIILCLDFTARFNFALEAGVQFLPAFRDPKWFFLEGGAHEEGGFIANVFLDAGLTAGLGVKGIACIAPRGYYSLPMTFTFRRTEGKKFPHKVINRTAGIKLVIQALFFTFRVDIMKPKTRSIYDNWKDNSEDNYRITDGEEVEYRDFYVDPAFDIDSGQEYTNDARLEQGAEIYATISDQGVIYHYDTDHIALPEFDSLPEAQGMQDPFTGNAETYNGHKGLFPKIEVPFKTAADAQANADGGNVFSDGRIQIVNLGEKMYYCRIATVEVSVPGNLKNIAAMTDLVDGEPSNDVFFVPTGRDVLPCMSYAAPEHDGEVGSFGLTKEYEELPFYKDQAKKAPVVSRMTIPQYGMYDTDAEYDEELYGNSVSSLNGRMSELAATLGWVGEGEAAPEDEREGMVPVAGSKVYRTRVVITPFDISTRTWGTTDVLDFTIPSQATKTLRCDMHDVDFTPVADVQSGTILFGIVSCTKPLKRDRTIDYMKEGLFTSALRYVPSPNMSGHGEIRDVNANAFKRPGEKSYEWKAIPFMINRIVGGRNVRQLGLATTGFMQRNALINYFYSISDNIEQAESPQDAVKNSIPAVGSSPNKQVLLPDYQHTLNDAGMLQIFIQPSQDYAKSDALLLCWQYSNPYDEKSYKPVEDEKASAQVASVQPNSERSTVWSIDPTNSGDFKHAPYDFKKGENFVVLGASKGFAWLERNDKATEVKMYNVRVASDGTLSDYDKPVDLGNCDFSRFWTTGTGNMLYGVQIKEGSVSVPSDEVKQDLLEVYQAGGKLYQNESGFCAYDQIDYVRRLEANEDKPEVVKQYQVIAARWDPIHRRYRMFFPYARLQAAPDDAAAYPLRQVGKCMGGTTFVYSTLKDVRKQLSSLTYAEITPVVSLEYQSAVCFDSFISEGKWTIHPRVRVRNNGNMPIRGFSVSFQTDTLKLGTITLTNLEKHVLKPIKPVHEKDVQAVMESEGWDSANALLEQPFAHLEDVDENDWDKSDEAIIWPGSIREYEITLDIDVDLKKGWQKSNPVTVRVFNPIAPDFDDTSDERFDTFGNDLSETVFDNEGVYQTFCGFTGFDGADMFDLDLSENEIGPGEEVKPCNYEIVPNENFAKTGDDSNMWGVAGIAAVAAAGAGAAAVATKKMKDKRDAGGDEA